MKTVYFNVHDGLVFSEDSIAGEEALSQGRALKALAPDNVESWRLSYDVITQQVSVYGGIEKSNQQAAEQLTASTITKKAEENDSALLLRKNSEKNEAEAKLRRKQLLASKLAENPNLREQLISVTIPE